MEDVKNGSHINQDVKIMDLAFIFAENIRIIISIPFLFFTISIFYLFFFAEEEYTSTSKIMSSAGSNNVSAAAGIASQFGLQIPEAQDQINWFYPDILRSNILAKALFKKNFDTIKYGKEKTLLEILNNGNQTIELNSNSAQVKAVNRFKKMVQVSENIRTKIFTIEVSGAEPYFVYQLNKALIDELNKFQKNYNKSRLKEARKFIEERIKETGNELMQAEEDRKNFSVSNRRIENSPKLLMEHTRLSREIAVLTGVFTTLKQQYETTKIEELKNSSYVITVEDPNLPVVFSSPKKFRVLIFGLFFGFFIAMVFIVLRRFIENNFYSDSKGFKKLKSVLIKRLKGL